uniref:Putative secreted protein n=1 Tax=Anopheles darlingi TaxID=43151 RepID=A0A2M4D7E4_ANODA
MMMMVQLLLLLLLLLLQAYRVLQSFQLSAYHLLQARAHVVRLEVDLGQGQIGRLRLDVGVRWQLQHALERIVELPPEQQVRHRIGVDVARYVHRLLHRRTDYLRFRLADGWIFDVQIELVAVDRALAVRRPAHVLAVR